MGLVVAVSQSIRSSLPSPCPSPHGRGDDIATVVQAFLLPWGEGQDEGRFPSLKAPSDGKFTGVI